jgi:hypothetical protein
MGDGDLQEGVGTNEGAIPSHGQVWPKLGRGRQAQESEIAN